MQARLLLRHQVGPGGGLQANHEGPTRAHSRSCAQGKTIAQSYPVEGCDKRLLGDAKEVGSPYGRLDVEADAGRRPYSLHRRPPPEVR